MLLANLHPCFQVNALQEDNVFRPGNGRKQIEQVEGRRLSTYGGKTPVYIREPLLFTPNSTGFFEAAIESGVANQGESDSVNTQ